MLLLCLLALIVMWSSVVRYKDPIGEKYFPLMPPGAADFSVIFDGTRVFLDGHNPYCYRDAGSLDRWGRGDVIGGRWFRVSCQPSHFLVYIPLALITSDNRVAGRLVFGVSVGLYLLLAFLTWRLVLRVATPSTVPGTWRCSCCRRWPTCSWKTLAARCPWPAVKAMSSTPLFAGGPSSCSFVGSGFGRFSW